jgi:hypothetical protein
MKKAFITIIVILIIAAASYFMFIRSKTAGVSDLQSPQALDSVMAEPFDKTYESPDFHFSFKYPDGFVVNPVQQDNGTIFTISEPKSGINFQIEVGPFNDPATTITAERVRSDLPNEVIIDPQPVIFGSHNAGTTFQSKNVDIDTREIWFVANGLLYQISSPVEFEPVLKNLMLTWKFI